jgi:hypothetical protein
MYLYRSLAEIAGGAQPVAIPADIWLDRRQKARFLPAASQFTALI